MRPNRPVPKKGSCGERHAYWYALCIATLLILCCVSARPLQADEKHTLAAFSLSAARNAIESGNRDDPEVRYMGFITRVWAVLLDDNDDIIIVGERDPDLNLMWLDDAVVALRTMDKVSTSENPGVSIQPPKKHGYTGHQLVKYFGGIDNTHYGTICFQADLLLKHLSMGFAEHGIYGFPSEWDLLVDNAKAGRRTDPWVQTSGMSWFYPLLVRIAVKDRCAVLTSITMEIQTDLDRELEVPREYIELDESSIAEALEDNPEAVSVTYARLFTQHFDSIAARYPVLVQLQNCLVLSGLMSKLLSDSTLTDLKYWKEDYEVEQISNPASVPTLSRGVNGLGYNMITSGGIASSFEVVDAWTDAVLSRKPKYLKDAVLRSRPSREAVSWIVPLQLGTPDKWSEDSMDRLQGQERERIRTVYTPAPAPAAGEKLGGGHWSNLGLSWEPKLRKTTGWHPSTAGNNLIAFKGRLHFSSGGFEAYSPDGRFSVSGADISFGVPISLRCVLANRLELEATLPFVFRMDFEDRLHRTLPGISDQIISYVTGMDDLVVAANFILLDGISKGRWRFPSVTLDNSVSFPTSQKVAEGYLSGEEYADEYPIEFGHEHRTFSHGAEIAFPLRNRFWFYSWGQYQTDWKGSTAGDRRLWGGGVNVRAFGESNMSLGFYYLTSSRKEAVWTESAWRSQGNQYQVVLSFPTRSGINSFGFGWYDPGRSAEGHGGTFLMSIDLSGTHLWEKRLWF